MARITQQMKEILEKAKNISAVATSTKDGFPNVVPISHTKVISDDEILLMDMFMKKSKQNIELNPNVAISTWIIEEGKKKGYQFKGEARIENSGDVFEEGVKWVKSEKPDAKPESAIIVKVKSIYITSPGPDAGKEVT